MTAVAVGVPSALDPAEAQRRAGLGPEAAEHVVVAAEAPLAIEFHQASHLPVGGGEPPAGGPAQGQVHTETHVPLSWVAWANFTSRMPRASEP